MNNTIWKSPAAPGIIPRPYRKQEITYRPYTFIDGQAEECLRKESRCIISISSLFPLDLFPSTINVEESRITIIYRRLLGSECRTVEIKDISNVILESSVLLSTMEIVTRTFVQNDIKVANLLKGKAEKVRKIIEGLRLLQKHRIDPSLYEIDTLIAMIEDFYNDHHLR